MYFSFGMPHPVISHYRQPRRLKAARPSHRAMEGRFVSWDSPPRLDGMTGHAGEFPYCRCYPEPVIPKGDGTRKTFAPALPTQAQEKARGTQRLLTHWERSLPQGQQSWPEVVLHMPGEPLYNVGKAVFVPKKLTHYSLDFAHERGGKQKARAFLLHLGFEKRHAAEIEKIAMQGILKYTAIRGKTDMHGERFNVYVPMTGPNGRTGDVMTSWIYRRTGGKISTTPELINCFLDATGIKKLKKDYGY